MISTYMLYNARITFKPAIIVTFTLTHFIIKATMARHVCNAISSKMYY